MIAPTKMSFQLTPLLDLLLIVIFAQFLDVREAAGEAESDAAEKVAAARAATAAELDAGRAELAVERARLDARRQALAADAADVEAAKSFLAADREDLVETTKRIASRMAKLFDIPAAVAEEAFRVQDPPAVPASGQDVDRLRERLEELAERAGRAVVEHVLTYDELLKRADVWRVRVDDAGRVTLTAGERKATFRAADAEQFVEEANAVYRTLPEPKGLVIVMVSYGDARAGAREAALDGLDRWLRELREERLGRTQFAPAILGYVPEETGGTD